MELIGERKQQVTGDTLQQQPTDPTVYYPLTLSDPSPSPPRVVGQFMLLYMK